MRVSRAGGVVTLLAALALVPAMPARAEVTCAPPAAVAPASGVPWPQARYDLHRLAGIADGGGVTVAVVDSGVDATHPQLTGTVVRGEDLLTPGGTGQRDCVGHGTAVASIIAGNVFSTSIANSRQLTEGCATKRSAG